MFFEKAFESVESVIGLILVCVVICAGSLVGVMSPLDLGISNGAKSWVRVILCFISLFAFYGGCRLSETQVDGETSGEKLLGVATLMVFSVLFMVANMLSTFEAQKRVLHNIVTSRNQGVFGVLLTLGASAIIFGFLDNYGMKLGTGALEATVFKSQAQKCMRPNKTDKKYGYYSDKTKFAELMTQCDKAIDEFMQGGTWVPKCPLEGVKSQNEFVEYVRNVRESMDSANSMMGNTFSDFVGAMLGAGVSKLFEYITGVTGDLDTDDFAIRFLQNPVTKVILEAVFIALGCLIPIGLHFGAERSKLYKGTKPSRLASFFRDGEQRPDFFTFHSFVSLMVGIVVTLMALSTFKTTKDAPVTETFEMKTDETYMSMSGVAIGTTVFFAMYAIFYKANDNETKASSK